MARKVAPLSSTFCSNAKHNGSPSGVKHSDGDGLYLLVKPAGKYWRIDYSLHGKRNTYAAGVFPKITLAEAREIRSKIRIQVAKGIDPNLEKRHSAQQAKTAASTTYEFVAKEFHKIKRSGWSEGHAVKWLRMNELYVFPEIGNMPIDAIRAKTVLSALRKIEQKGIQSTAHDVQQMVGQVFRFAVQVGHLEHNPIPNLKGALRPHTPKHFPAIVEPSRIGELPRAIDGYTGQPTTTAALQLSPLLFQRPGNIRAMEWSWVDLKSATLCIPSASMKGVKERKQNGKPHIVPLADQAVKILQQIHDLTGNSKYVFPSVRTHSRPMSDGTINAALRRLDFGSDEHVAHGFRATARTVIEERIPGIDPSIIEAALGHGKSGPLGSAYDRAEYLQDRKAVFQTWANYLDELRSGASIIPIRSAA